MANRSRKADDSGEADLSEDPHAFISVNPPSGVERDPALGPVRTPRLAFESWMKDKGWTEVPDSASAEVQPTTAGDDETISNVPPVES
jgi:hypothetical protein